MRRFGLVVLHPLAATSLLVLSCSAAPSPGDDSEPEITMAGGAGNETGGSAGASVGTAGSSPNAGGATGTGGDAANGGAGAAGASSSSGTAGSGGAKGGAGGGGGQGGSGGAGGAGGSYVMPPGSGTPGQWSKITMPVSFKYAMSLVADPVRVNDYYGFLTDGATTDLHVVKSTDYGATWSVVNSTNMKGDPWGAAIDTNLRRDSKTSPTIYTPAGYGSNGLWKSTDGGVTWTQYMMGGNNPFSAYTPYPWDIYSVSILPDDPPNHILVTWHGYWEKYAGGADAGLGESFDGGQTWTVHPPPAGFGQSHYMMIIDATTWLTISQDNNGQSGIWKTTTAGRVNGSVSVAAWKKVDSLEHIHGCFNPVVTSSALYAAGSSGIKRSTDQGETWKLVHGSAMSSIVATGKYLYADWLLSPNLVRSPLADGTTWSTYTTAPATFKGGLGPGTSTHVASTDGQHWYIVVNQNDGGVWRYIE